MASYDVASNIYHALGGGLARLALQRVQELFRDAQWAQDLSVQSLLNAVLLEMHAVVPELVQELGMADIARSAGVDASTPSLLRSDKDVEAEMAGAGNTRREASRRSGPARVRRLGGAGGAGRRAVR